MSKAYWAAVIITAVIAGIGALLAAGVEKAGLPPAVEVWLGVLGAVLGTINGFLPRLHRPDEAVADDDPPPRLPWTKTTMFIPAFLLLVPTGSALAQPPAKIVPTGWRARMEQKLDNLQRQPSPSPAPQADNTPAFLALIAQLAMRPPVEHKTIVYYMPPQQVLPISGVPQQIIPIAGVPQQVLPVPGVPQQVLPVPGVPQQVLPVPGVPQQQLPVQPQAIPKDGTVPPPAPAWPPPLKEMAPAPQQKLPTGQPQRYVPALYRR